MSMPNFRLDQQTALVTGAASGIGRGVALGLAAAGANVACFDLPETGLDEVCDEIMNVGQQAIVVPGDVMDADMLNNSLLDQGGNRDLFVNAINWLANDQDIIGERPSREKPFVTTFIMTEKDGRWLLTMSTVVLPGLFFLTGIAVFFWRRQHG